MSNYMKKVRLFRRVTYFLIFIVKLSHSFGQPQTFRFDNLSMEEGLSENWVTKVYRDSRGLLWIGTRYGLNVYNGYQVKNYFYNDGNQHSIPDNYITTIYEDNDSTIWIGSTRGLFRYNKEIDGFETIKLSTHPDNQQQSIEIREIVRYDKYLFLATWKYGLIMYNPENGNCNFFKYQKTYAHSISSDNINDIVIRGDYLWLGTSGGYINKFDILHRTSQRIPMGKTSQKPITKTNNDKKTLQFDNDGNLWIGSSEYGIWKYNHSTDKFKHFSKSKLNGLSHNIVFDLELIDDKIWVATDNGGINIIDPETDTFQYLNSNLYDPLSLSSDGIWDIFTDKFGNIFAGTFDAGVDYYSPAKNIFELYYNVPNDSGTVSHSNVNRIVQTIDGTIWVGTNGGGLNVFDPKTKTFSRFFSGKPEYSINAPYISDLYADSAGNLIVSAYDEGFSIYNIRTKTIRNFTHTPNCTNCPASNNNFGFYKDSKGVFWYSSLNKGIETYNPVEKLFTLYKIDIDDPNSPEDAISYDIAEDDNGNLWFVTEKSGLTMFSTEENKFYRYKKDVNHKILSSNKLKGLKKDKKGNIWICSENGLNYFNPDKKTSRVYTTEDGLPSNHILNVLIDKNSNLWISTFNGISFFNTEKETFRNFKKYFGLTNNPFNNNSGFIDNQGFVYFGGQSGLIRFEPGSLISKPEKHKIVLSEFKINNKPALINDNGIRKHVDCLNAVDLYKNDKIFSVEFACPDIIFPDQIQYRYKLEGFDEDWYITSGRNRKIAYSSLSGGNYVLKIQSTNSSGTWLDNTRELEIVVHPPFYKTSLFIILLITGFVGLLIFGYKIRLNYMKKQSEMLRSQVAERTRELEDRNAEITEQNQEIIQQRDLANSQKEIIEKQKKEIEAHKNNLEKQVNERTQELLIAKEKAEESDRLKTSFLKNMSHEIRTPMNAILGFLELVFDPTYKKQEKQTYKSYIYESANSLLTVIEDILDLAKIETGQLKFAFHSFHINDLLYRLEVYFKEYVSQHHSSINVKFTGPFKDFKLTTDEKRLNQVLSNLINNAVKFTPEGEILFGYELTDKFVRFYVSDTGIGIKKEYHHLIFEHFTKIEDSKEKLFRGTGLGLSICKSMVEELGGTIWVESTVDKGSTFHFTIPYEPKNKISSHEEKETSDKKNNFDIKDITILVAEDDDLNYFYISKILERWQTKHLRTKNGLETLHLIEVNSNVDIILMDIKMPLLDGLEATKKIREQGKNIPIIALTAYSRPEDKEDFLKNGCDDFICKPIDSVVLRETIYKYTKKQK